MFTLRLQVEIRFELLLNGSQSETRSRTRETH